MTTDTAILAQGLTKTFAGGVQALTGLDLAVPAGAVYGLIGRNGAGKTTAIRLLMGLLRADAGSARILGQDLWQAGPEHRCRVAYVSQEQQVHAWMTLTELCQYCAHFYPAWDQPYAAKLAGRFGMDLERQIGLMSGGERRKAAILLALAARPAVLVMDEPAAGLDPIARRELLDALIESLGEGQGQTVLFSTHIIQDLERVADHVGIMDRGRLLGAAPLEELQAATKRVQIVFPGAAVPPDFSLPGAIRPQVSGPVYTAVVRLAGADTLSGLGTQLGARVDIFPLGLEDIFIELVGKE